MSDVLYPIGLINSIKVTPTKSVVMDEFESGAENTRLLWPAGQFKRRVELEHAPLNESEFARLLSFYQARNGTYDYFWFRDNVNRKGNLKVRFDRESDYVRQGRFTMVKPTLREIAPIPALPEVADVIAAAGAAPTFWFDANRELYVTHNGVTTIDQTTYDAAGGGFGGRWLGNFSELNFGGMLSQYQSYKFGDFLTPVGPYPATFAQSLGSISFETIFGQPVVTLFIITKNPSVLGKGVLLSLGSATAGGSLGIAISPSGYQPWVGASETWSTAIFPNTPNNLFRSIAVTWALASNVCKLYANGALIGSESNSRAFSTGPVAIGGGQGGAFAFGSPGENHVNHAMMIQSECSLSQIKALHNLFAYQYGLAAV